MRKILIILILGLIAFFAISFRPNPNIKHLKEGDLIFQTSKSSQSLMVCAATSSRWSHCGIIVYKDDKPYVFEASHVVKLTPLKEWINRGRFKAYDVKRVFDKDIKIKYKRYLGMPYDLAFKFDNDKMYCSELIYEVYKKQHGVELCKPRKVKDYHLLWTMSKKMKKRGISKDQLAVSPEDIYSSDKVKSIN